MPKVSRDTVQYRADGFESRFDADVFVDTSGVFYAFPRCDVFDLIKRDRKFREDHHIWLGDSRKKDGAVCAQTMYDLHYAFTKALEIVCTPTVTTERVILYMLRSHVSFAEQPDGTIVPNARWPNAVWNHSEAFGGHHATKQSDGYSMHVGARAYTKTTRVYAQSDPVVDYELFYGIGPDGRPNDHFEREHPAGLLNSWMSYYLPDPCDEMPYTDEAALWFHRLMQSMAEMQRRIQRMVQDKPKFIEVVNSGLNLPFSGRSS